MSEIARLHRLSSLRPDTVEWLTCAESDIRAVRRLDLMEDRFAITALCCIAAERYLRAVLIGREDAVGDRPELPRLIELCAEADAEFAQHWATAAALQPFALDARHPPALPGEVEVESAIRNVLVVRAFCRRKLGIPDTESSM